MLLFLGLLVCFVTGCTVRHAPLEPGLIPNAHVPTSQDERFGHGLLSDLQKDYELCATHPRYEQLNQAFAQITKAAGADHVPWHIHVFSDPEIIDVRAVHGNRMFVWSGFLDAVINEDEIAAVLAGEMGHVLSHHTDPVRFHVLSNVFFQMASMAANVGILYLTQGAVAIAGNWSKWVYMKAANLTPLDREYNEEEERQAAALALRILQRSRYSPEALAAFWCRVDEDEALKAMSKDLQRDLSPKQRIALLEETLPGLAQREEPDPQEETALVHAGEWPASGVFHPAQP